MPNSFKNAGSAIATTGTVLYTCPSSTEAVIHALYISNTDSVSPVSANIEVTVDGGTTYFHVGKTLLVPEDSTLIPDKPINLEAGDKLKLTASAANKMEAVCSILEITP